MTLLSVFSRRLRRALLGGGAAVLLTAGPAHADAPILQLIGAPIAKATPCYPGLDPSNFATTAGAYTDFCAAYYVRGGRPEDDDPKRVVFDTPQGFLATSDVSPQCTLVQYEAANTGRTSCPAATQIGDGSAQVRVAIAGFPLAQTAPVRVFNLEHTDDELGKIGVELAPTLAGIPFPRTKLIGRITLRPAPDAGLRTILDGLPQHADLGPLGRAPIATDGFSMRFWGRKADHPTLARDFAFLGSDCSKPQVTTATSTSWKGDVSTARYEYGLTECDTVRSGLTASIVTSERRPDVTTETTVSLRPEQTNDNRVRSNIARTAVTLPPGMGLAGQIASGPDGFPLCTREQFAYTAFAKSTCPDASQVGAVAFTSPLIRKAFVGSVFLGSQPAEGDLPEIFIEAGTGALPDSPRVKMIGQMRWDDQNRIVASLEELPQMTFSEFRLTFRGGPHSVLTTPRSCGTFEGFARAVPSSGGPDATATMPVAIDQDCIDPNAFQPTVVVSTSSAQAGAASTTSITVVRPDRQARIVRLDADLPPGLLADLNGVGICSADEFAAKACPAASRIGRVEASAGVGPEPVSSSGEAYLMDPPPGAAAGVGVIVPVRFGDVDLGRLALGARIDLRQADFGLRLSADVPTRFRGFPLDLQRLTVALDRPGFGRNPTSCAPLTSGGQLVSDLGPVAAVSARLQFSGCEGMAFAPAIQTQITGSTAPYGRPGVNVRLSVPAGHAAIRRATVTLPLGLGADLKVAGRSCPVEQFDAGACPASTIVGSAVGRVAIAPDALTGPVYLVQAPGSVLPGIGLQFTGRFASRIRGSLAVAKTGQVVADFANVPDVPLTSLDLSFTAGAGSALIASPSLCQGPVTFDATFESQGGHRTAMKAPFDCSRPASKRALLSGRLGTSLRLKLTAPRGQRIRSGQIRLPSGVTVKRAGLGKGGLLRRTGSRYTLRRTGSRTLRVTPRGKAPATLTIAVPRSALAFTAAANRRKKLTVSVALTLTDGSRQRLAVSLRR